MRPAHRFTLAALAAVSFAAAQAAGPAPLGRWITESGNLEVEVAPCGDALCGTVVRVLANRSMSAPGQEMAPVDGRPALGMTILSQLRPGGDGEWNGSIYNRENGKTYSVRVSPGTAAGELLVRGYVGLPLFGKTQVWRRAPAAAAAAATAAASGSAR